MDQEFTPNVDDADIFKANIGGFNINNSSETEGLGQSNQSNGINRNNPPEMDQSNYGTKSPMNMINPEELSSIDPSNAFHLTETKELPKLVPLADTFSDLVEDNKHNEDSFNSENVGGLNVMDAYSANNDSEYHNSNNDICIEQQTQHVEELPEKTLPTESNVHAPDFEEFENTDISVNKIEGDQNLSMRIGVDEPNGGALTDLDSMQTSSPNIGETVEETEKESRSFSPSFQERENSENVYQEREFSERSCLFPVQQYDGALKVIEEIPEDISVNQIVLKSDTMPEGNIYETTNVEITKELNEQTMATNDIAESKSSVIGISDNYSDMGSSSVFETLKDNDSLMQVSEHSERFDTGSNVFERQQDNDSSFVVNYVDGQMEKIDISSPTNSKITSFEPSELGDISNEGDTLLPTEMSPLTAPADSKFTSNEQNEYGDISNEKDILFPTEMPPSTDHTESRESPKLDSFFDKKQPDEFHNEEVLLQEEKNYNIVDNPDIKLENVETIINEPNEGISQDFMSKYKIENGSETKAENEVKINPEECEESPIQKEILTEFETGKIKTASETVQNEINMPTYMDNHASINEYESIEVISAKHIEETKVTRKEADSKENKQECIKSKERNQTPLLRQRNQKSPAILEAIKGKTKREVKIILSQDAFDRATELLKTVHNKSNVFEDGLYVHPLHQAYATELKGGKIILYKYIRQCDGQVSADSDYYENVKSYRRKNDIDYINMKISGRKRRKSLGRFIFECCNKVILMENVFINYIDGNKHNHNPSNLSPKIQIYRDRSNVNHA
ncbi:hypothetical protein Ahia01_000620700 [Argonauta hians]